MTCKDCLYYSEGKRFYHPKHKQETYFSICNFKHRLITRAYGLNQAEKCKNFMKK